MPVVTLLPCHITSRGSPVFTETSLIYWPLFDEPRLLWNLRPIALWMRGQLIRFKWPNARNYATECSFLYLIKSSRRTVSLQCLRKTETDHGEANLAECG